MADTKQLNSELLFQPDIFSDWNKIRAIISPLYESLTSFPLDYNIDIFREEEFMAKSGQNFFVSGIALLHCAMVKWPEDASRESLIGFYFGLFHELGHLTSHRTGMIPLERQLFEMGVLSGFEIWPQELEQFWNLMNAVGVKDRDFLHDTWMFSHAVEESRAEAFSIFFGSKFFADDRSTLGQFAEYARKQLILSAFNYWEGSALGWNFIRSLSLIVLLAKNAGDIERVVRKLFDSAVNELAKEILAEILEKGVLEIINILNLVLTQKFSLGEIMELPAKEGHDMISWEDLSRVGKSGNEITVMLKHLCCGNFARRIKQIETSLFNPAILNLIKALKDQKWGSVIDLLEKNEYSKKDRLFFYLGQYLEAFNGELSQKLFRRILEQYPKSEWRYKAQHHLHR